MRSGPDRFAEFTHSSSDGVSGREHVTVSRHLGDRVPSSLCPRLSFTGQPLQPLPSCCLASARASSPTPPSAIAWHP